MMTVAEELRKMLADCAAERKWCDERIAQHEEKLVKLRERKAQHEERAGELVRLLQLTGETIERTHVEECKASWASEEDRKARAALETASEIPF